MNPAPDRSGGSPRSPGDFGGPGGGERRYEIVIHTGRSRVWAARARGLGHRGQSGMRRLRAYLRTPEGQRAAVRTVQAVAVVGAGAAGIVLLRRWVSGLARVGRVFAPLVGALRLISRAARSGFATLGRAGRAGRVLVPARWMAALVRWLTFGGVVGRACRCPDCHARVRSDARVCHRCGYRPAAGAVIGQAAAARRGVIWGPAVWIARILALRLYRRCPDCRRAVHVDARLCRACGYRLRRPPAGSSGRVAP